MKTMLNTAIRLAASAPLATVAPSAAGIRPVRRGSFWPGEDPIRAGARSDIGGVSVEYDFTLPAMISHGSDIF